MFEERSRILGFTIVLESQKNDGLGLRAEPAVSRFTPASMNAEKLCDWC